MICFVNHRSYAPDVSTICFLAWDTAGEIVHCMIHCENVFKKKLDREMSDFLLQTEPLGPKAKESKFLDLLSEIR